MARASRTTDPPRSRSKASLIEEVGRGIEQFQDILVSIEDFSREGFPYRDAARAKAELQLRECVRRIFGERSPEFQMYRSHKLRGSSKAEAAQSVQAVKTLIHTLEGKKSELQGLKLTKAPATGPSPAVVTPTTSPGSVIINSEAEAAIPSTTISVAMTTNLAVPAPLQTASFSTTAVAPPSISTSLPSAIQNAKAPSGPPLTQLVSQAPPDAPTPMPDGVSPAPAQAVADPAPPPLVVELAETASTPPPPLTAPMSTPPPTQASPVVMTVQQDTQEAHPERARDEQDPLERIRKMCWRFHAVTRQLRLRKDYRPTLEVEDDYDLQDLLCALLKVEFDEVGVDEWIPPYTEGAPRKTFLIHRDEIAIVAKKTRPGLTMQELADQVSADSARYANREKCATLFCFILRSGRPRWKPEAAGNGLN